MEDDEAGHGRKVALAIAPDLLEIRLAPERDTKAVHRDEGHFWLRKFRPCAPASGENPGRRRSVPYRRRGPFSTAYWPQKARRCASRPRPPAARGRCLRCGP